MVTFKQKYFFDLSDFILKLTSDVNELQFIATAEQLCQ